MKKANGIKMDKSNDRYPKVSVIIPVYNVKEYLRKCLDSVISQTYSNLEIIIVDDGSTDGSQGICDEYTSDLRVRVIHKKNGGLSDARNAGLDAVTGDYVTFIDSDDYIHKKMIEKLTYGCMAYNAEISACRYSTHETEGWKEGLSVMNEDCFSLISAEEAIRLMLLQKKITHVSWCKLYQSQLFESQRFPAGRLYEDYATTYRLFGEAEKVVLVDVPLYLYCQRENSIQNSKFSEKNFDELRYAIKCKKYIDEKFPNLRMEAICRLVSSCFHIVFLAYGQEQYYPQIEKAILTIKRYRMKCILSPRMSKKVRAGCLLSYMGIPIEYKVFSILGMRGKIGQ